MGVRSVPMPANTDPVESGLEPQHFSRPTAEAGQFPSLSVSGFVVTLRLEAREGYWTVASRALKNESMQVHEVRFEARGPGFEPNFVDGHAVFPFTVFLSRKLVPWPIRVALSKLPVIPLLALFCCAYSGLDRLP